MEIVDLLPSCSLNLPSLPRSGDGMEEFSVGAFLSYCFRRFVLGLLRSLFHWNIHTHQNRWAALICPFIITKCTGLFWCCCCCCFFYFCFIHFFLFIRGNGFIWAIIKTVGVVSCCHFISLGFGLWIATAKPTMYPYGRIRLEDELIQNCSQKICRIWNCNVELAFERTKCIDGRN